MTAADPNRFFLSFHGPAGLCRISHGRTLDEAINDCLNSATGTGMTSSLLDYNFKVIGEVHRLRDVHSPSEHFQFIHA